MTITKTVWQYSDALPEETTAFLRGVAADYAKVKDYVYRRYAGVKSVGRLTPVYTVFNEMRRLPLRAQLALPVVYYELAIAEAVADIKSMWGVLKNTIRQRIRENDGLTDDDRAYIRTVLRVDSLFAAVLGRAPHDPPKNAAALSVDAHRLDNLIRRLARRYRETPRVRAADAFRVSPAGYRYKDGGLYLVSRVPRRRVYLPLKDAKTSSRQIQIRLLDGRAAIAIPIDREPKADKDRQGVCCIHIGYQDMFTLSNGHIYGAGLARLVSPETDRLYRKNQARALLRLVCAKSRAAGDAAKADAIARNNLGTKKYDAQKRKKRAETQNFIHAEINRMLAAEKPKKIIVTRLVIKRRAHRGERALARRLTRSFGGYIRRRLAHKCQLRAIELVTVSARDTGRLCSVCGAEGARDGQMFSCAACGFRASAALNAAKNIEALARRGGLLD